MKGHEMRSEGSKGERLVKVIWMAVCPGRNKRVHIWLLEVKSTVGKKRKLTKKLIIIIIIIITTNYEHGYNNASDYNDDYDDSVIILLKVQYSLCAL